jgi:hypothetical protein
MKFQLLHKTVKGIPVVSLNTVMRAVHIWLLTRQIHNARILPTATATRPARLRHSPRRSPALLQPHHSLRDDGDGDAVTSVPTYVFPANLKMVEADPSTSSPAMTMSRPPQAMSRRGSGPSNHPENNYFIRDRGWSCLNPQRPLSPRPPRSAIYSCQCGLIMET